MPMACVAPPRGWSSSAVHVLLVQLYAKHLVATTGPLAGALTAGGAPVAAPMEWVEPVLVG
jgi:hypothetical protein